MRQQVVEQRVDRPKVIFIEWDGATWDIINELLKQDRLPRFRKIMESGVAGSYSSELPLLSPRIWTSIFTGKRPNAHGVEFFGATSRDVKCNRIWDIADAAGLRVGVMGSLITWPPRQVNGFIVPSVFALGTECHPPELQFLQELILNERKQKERGVNRIHQAMKYLIKLLGHGMRLSTLAAAAQYFAYEKIRRPSFLDRYWRTAFIHLRLTTDVFARLHSLFKPDFAAFHIHLCDAICHRYWAFWEPAKFDGVSEELAARFGSVIPLAYEEVDRALGRIAGLVDEQTTLIIASDHGFGAQPVTLYPFKLEPDRLLKIMQLETKVIPASIARSTFLYFQDAELKAQIRDDLSKVRLESSGAELLKVRDEENYLEVSVKGELLLEQIPQGTVVDFGRWGKYAFETLFSKAGLHISGIHQPEAVLVLSGSAINKKACLKSPALYDLAPTMLALLGLPVGQDMEGRVLSEILTEDFLEAHPVTYTPTHESGTEQDSSHEEVDYEKVKDRLKSLGYL
jgi:hypothetical protein